MSGIEVFGILASAVQLAQTCSNIAAFAIDLFSRVRQAPEIIRKRIANIEQFIEIERLIKDKPLLQTPLIGSILATCHEDADQLLEILREIDTRRTARKVVKYWKLLVAERMEWRILTICERLQQTKSTLGLCIISVNSGLQHDVNLRLATVHQGIENTVKALPAIRDTAHKITAIHDDMPAMANKVAVVHDGIPRIRAALEQLALRRVNIVEPQSAPIQFIPSFKNPYGALGLNPNETITCIGYAKSKKRECHQRISGDSRAKADRIFSQLSTRTQIKDHLPQLRDLAKLLLCKQFHQTQAEKVAQQWHSNTTLTLLTPPPSPTLNVLGTQFAPSRIHINPTQRTDVTTPPPDSIPSTTEPNDWRRTVPCVKI